MFVPASFCRQRHPRIDGMDGVAEDRREKHQVAKAGQLIRTVCVCC